MCPPCACPHGIEQNCQPGQQVRVQAAPCGGRTHTHQQRSMHAHTLRAGPVALCQADYQAYAAAPAAPAYNALRADCQAAAGSPAAAAVSSGAGGYASSAAGAQGASAASAAASLASLPPQTVRGRGRRNQSAAVVTGRRGRLQPAVPHTIACA